MLNIPRIPTLDSYKDWLEKAEYELNKYEETSSVYDLSNCFLSLNALPEWILNSEHATSDLKELADSKLQIMKFETLDIEKVKNYDLNQLLRLVRLFCNHAKHSKEKEGFKRIRLYDTSPVSLPMKFEYLTIGNNEEDGVKSIELLKTIINFWREHIT